MVRGVWVWYSGEKESEVPKVFLFILDDEKGAVHESVA